MEKTTTRVYNNRLLKLADFLDTVPPARFDYTVWVGEDWKGAASLSCGTTACALGWATTMPAFRRLGLHLAKDRLPSVNGDESGDPEAAAEEIFGLDNEEFIFLFTPADPIDDGYDESDATPQQVAAKIRQFVERRREV